MRRTLQTYIVIKWFSNRFQFIFTSWGSNCAAGHKTIRDTVTRNDAEAFLARDSTCSARSRGSLGTVRQTMVARSRSSGMAGGRRLEVPGSEHSPTTPLQPAAGGQYTAEPGSSDAGEGEPDGFGASAGAAAPEPAGGVEPPGGATASAPSGKEGVAAAAGASPGAGPASSRRPPAGEPAPVFGHGYAVWYIPGRPELAGVHLGVFFGLGCSLSRPSLTVGTVTAARDCAERSRRLRPSPCIARKHDTSESRGSRWSFCTECRSSSLLDKVNGEHGLDWGGAGEWNPQPEEAGRTAAMSGSGGLARDTAHSAELFLSAMVFVSQPTSITIETEWVLEPTTFRTAEPC